MLEHFKGEEEFVRKIEDYAYQAEKGRMVLTKFLNPHEREVIQDVIGSRLAIHADGGIDHAESQRVIICPDYYEITPDDFRITVFAVEYNDSFGTLEHSDVLGALMHLGLERNVFGDILKDPLAFAICDENKEYVKLNIDKIKRSHVHLREMDERLEARVDYTTKRYFVSSLRLDKVLAAFYHLSRAKAAEAIARGDVKVNYKQTDEGSQILRSGDMISFRHHGRVKLADTGKMTKGNNLIVDALYYK